MEIKSKEQIEIEFDRAISQAQELEKIAADLSRLASANVDNAVNLLRMGWKGESANVFEKRGGVVAQDMYETAQDLMSVAKNIRLTADVVYRAEKKALKLIF